jgi:non-homologous end joining protein Ku
MAALTTLMNEVGSAEMRLKKMRDSYEKHIQRLVDEIAQARSQKAASVEQRPPPVPARNFLTAGSGSVHAKPKSNHPLKPSGKCRLSIRHIFFFLFV